MSCLGAAPRAASVSRSNDSGADRTFARSSRLRARKLFLELYEHGHRMNSVYFVLFGVRGAGQKSRLGITATKKFGHAVARNRIKRIIREIFRTNRSVAESPIDVVVNVKLAARGQAYDRLEADLGPRFCELRRRLRA